MNECMGDRESFKGHVPSIYCVYVLFSKANLKDDQAPDSHSPTGSA
jgi:hypothetical protein